MAKKNTSWGGRFKKHTAKKAQEFSSSIDIDNKLYKEDILGSIAYAEALQTAGVLNKSELSKIKSGLKQIKQKIESGKFNWQEALEDVHMNIESSLEKIIGAAAKKLHTGRSRNDQVVTDLKLYLLGKSKDIQICLTDLLEIIVLKAESEVETLMPG
ncbi:MAG: lyase family protein, partial [Gammaproteobacteria bacterium]